MFSPAALAGLQLPLKAPVTLTFVHLQHLVKGLSCVDTLLIKRADVGVAPHFSAAASP